VLHASGVCIGGRAILLAGAAGAGKSTLAALLARDGGQVMADDGVLLEPSGGALRAVPSYPGLRLFPESSAAAGIENLDGDVGVYTRKRRVLPGSAAIFQRAPAPVGHVYALSPGGSLVSIEPLSQRDAAVEILKYSYRADIEERGALQSQLDVVASASAVLSVWRLAYPRDLSRAGEVARAIAAHAAHGAPGGEEPI
jgi:hypothetical protein